MDAAGFQKVFTRKVSSASVTTAKSEEKRLEDDQYVPPPGHISFLKEKVCDGTTGKAKLVTLGGARMQETRTWKFAAELFCRNFCWSSGAFVLDDLLRLKCFQVTTTSARTCTGSVTTPLFGATFVDLEPEESNKFHLIIAFGEDVERFVSNSSILEVKGTVDDDKIEADVTKWLPEKVVYTEFRPPADWSDGSEFVQKGDVPKPRSGAQIGILSRPDPNSALILCTGGVCKPSPGPTRLLPEDSNIFLLELSWHGLVQDAK